MSPMPKTRFLCTVGPGTKDANALHALVSAGMGMARVNGSHGSLDDIRELIGQIRRHVPRELPILLDLPGNKVRTDGIDEPISLVTGETFVLRAENLTYRPLYTRVRPGFRISAADGAIQLEVTEVKGTEIHTLVVIGGLLANRKGINIKGIHDAMPFDFERDVALLTIAVECKVDYVGLSFVRDGEHVRRVKSQLVGTGVRIVAKVETTEAVADLDQILTDADMIMVDRGDLEADIGRENVPLTTKRVIRRAKERRVPVIVASQFLLSMMDKPLPTMAEVSDISNAVLDGADVLMLSEETAIGKFPNECVATMRTVAEATERHQRSDHRVVILAAGPSTGFGSLTTNKHKSMLDVGGTTIIRHQIENLAAAGIDDENITVVTGHNHRQIEHYLLGEGFKGRFLHNPWFFSTNILTSLWLTRTVSNLLVVYGDIIFDRDILADVLSLPGKAILAVDEQSELSPEDEKVIMENGRIIRGGKDLPAESCGGEFIGLARFDHDVAQVLYDHMDRVIKEGGLMDFLTVTFEPLARAGVELLPCFTQGRPWNDNDTLLDLDRSREHVYPRILEAHRSRNDAAARKALRS